MTKKTKKKHKPVVKGKQLASRVLLGRARRAKGRTEVASRLGEPSRLRFIEPPAKKEGNPFFAFRVPKELHRAFLAFAKKREPKADTATIAAADVLKGYMSKVTGVSMDGDNSE